MRRPDPSDAGGSWDGFDRIFDLAQAGPVIVDGCRLQSNRARAALLKSGASITVRASTLYGGRGLPALNCGMESETGEGPGPGNIAITGCAFYGNDGPSIFVGNDNAYFLAAARHILGANVTISANTFRDNCLPNPSIGANPQQYDYPVAVLVTCVKDVKISGNRFINNWGPNVGLFSDANVAVTGNTFVRPNEIQPWKEGTIATLGTVIYADNTPDLTLSGNTVSGKGPFSGDLLFTAPQHPSKANAVPSPPSRWMRLSTQPFRNSPDDCGHHLIFGDCFGAPLTLPGKPLSLGAEDA